MTEQPRDEKGRFAKKKEKVDYSNTIGLLIALSLMFGAVIGLVCGDTIGYNRGYHAGLADNQDTIRAQGFSEGMAVADNQNELANEWMPCFINTSPQKFVCSIKDNNTVAEVGKDYKIVKVWHFPEDMKKFLIEWVKE